MLNIGDLFLVCIALFKWSVQKCFFFGNDIEIKSVHLLSSGEKESVLWVLIRENKLIMTVLLCEMANPTVRTFLFLLIGKPEQNIKKIHFHISFEVP